MGSVKQAAFSQTQTSQSERNEMKILLLASIILAATRAEIKKDEGVLVLTNDNFEEARAMSLSWLSSMLLGVDTVNPWLPSTLKPPVFWPRKTPQSIWERLTPPRSPRLLRSFRS